MSLASLYNGCRVRFAVAGVPFDLGASFSHSAGVPYVHQTVLNTNLLYLHLPVPPVAQSQPAARLRIVRVFIEPAAGHLGLPASVPQVSVYGVAQSGAVTLLGSADDADLVAAQYEQNHVCGYIPISGSTPSGANPHDHESRGVLLGSGSGIDLAPYYGIQLRIRGESGTDSVAGLRIQTVELNF
jgi:hypothetical protein